MRGYSLQFFAELRRAAVWLSCVASMFRVCCLKAEEDVFCNEGEDGQVVAQMMNPLLLSPTQ
jgi:hypothetical protein